jgi:hypothetical protein
MSSLVAIRLPQVDAEGENSASRVDLDMFVGSTQPPKRSSALLKSIYGKSSVVLARRRW